MNKKEKLIIKNILDNMPIWEMLDLTKEIIERVNKQEIIERVNKLLEFDENESLSKQKEFKE